ncbi:MAG: hypothetical protein SO053_04065 [Bifidobacterium animalis]|nr:hypothetical protein [Bifidobacterium animalis]
MAGRTIFAAKNAVWGIAGNIINALLSFISRTVFINVLGTQYLGVNGLFTNILGMLSLAELGVGSAISFSLYKPLAENDTKQIQAIINFYRRAYRVIALIVAVVGLCIMPFLHYFVRGVPEVQNIYTIYLIFLFNSVTSYLITYKTTLLSADQRNYLITNINTSVKVITIALQIAYLLVVGNYIGYLLIDATVQLLSKFYLNHFTDKRYPYIRGKNDARLSKKDKSTIFTKIRALMLHKVGEVSVYQTDNIITSAFISTAVVGLVSNFTLIINTVNTFVLSIFNSMTASFGNLIATETTEKQIHITKRYDFMCFVFFGWTAVSLYILLDPFIILWIGRDRLIGNLTVMLLCINYYLTGMRVGLTNVKTAAGIFEQDKWIALCQAVANLAFSIILVRPMGLAGVYMGTLISSMIPNISRPYIVYKYLFKRSCIPYLIEYMRRFIELTLCAAIIKGIDYLIPCVSIYLRFLILLTLCITIPALLLILVYHKSDEFQYFKGLTLRLKNKVLRRKHA